MGKQKRIVGKSEINSKKYDKFIKKRKLNKNFKNDRNIHKTELDSVEHNIPDNKNDESEDENPFDQLVKSFKGNLEKSNCVSSSDSESDSDVNEKNTTISEEEDNLESHDEDDNISLAEDDLEKDYLLDPFEIHFQRDMRDEFYNILSATTLKVDNFQEKLLDFPTLGKCKFFTCNTPHTEVKENSLKIDLSGESSNLFAVPADAPNLIKQINWDHLHVKPQICANIEKANLQILKSVGESQDKILTPLQKELFSIINNYQDIYYPERTLDNGEEVRFVYCLHAINHALKTRLKVIHHNSRLSDRTDVPEEFRDQGLVRPKVLIVVPFRESALRVINNLISILLDEKANVGNKKRFLGEFTGGEIAMPKKNPKPLDYERLFQGNTDDNFKIGLSVTKKSLKLYADFYSSDIIVASPLGLRLVIGAEGESERDFDFLAAIEVLILDETDVFLMQNWDHMLHVFDHLHCQPQKSHGTDFSRVRNWALNGWTKYYRQTLMFSSTPLPLITALFTKKCNNYAGKVTVSNAVELGTICQVVIKVPQVFCRVDCNSSVTSVDNRFNYFITEVLPQMKDPFMKHTLLYVPSYLDYVVIRNYFKKETISFVQICEYSKEGKIARARDKFFHGESHFLLYTERFHFSRRIRVKGIRHIVFYQPPSFSHFYSEICNLLQDDKDSNVSVTTLYTKFDVPQLSAIVGTERAKRIMKSNNSVYRILAE